MTEPRTFVIRRAFIFPFGLLLLSTLALLVICLVQGQPVAKAVILGGLMLPLSILFVECAWRRIVLDEQTITAFRPFREKRICFVNVTSLEAVQVRSRVFLTVVAGDDDFLIISNSYGNFQEMVRELAGRVPLGTVTEEAQAVIDAPVTRQADVVTAWLAVCAMTYVLVAQFVR
jgi:hypothetical protein